MRMKVLSCAAAVLAMAAMPAQAQVLSGKWSGGTRTYKINVNMPQRADTVTNSAAAKWTNAGARITLSNGGIEYDRDAAGGSTTTTDRAKSTIEDGPPVIVNGVESTAYVKQQINSDGTMYDADMIVNSNLIYADKFFYDAGTPPSHQFHYYSVVLHEFGHVIGFADQYTNTACVTHGNLSTGQVRLNLCGPEVTALKNGYGIR
jgi:hypothetical protein